MVTKQIKELEVTKAKMAALERAIARNLKKELASLPGKYGFDLNEFIRAVKDAVGGRKTAGAKKPEGKRRKRAVITDETRNAVKKLVEAGKTGSEIAKTLKISLPSVQNIKKALGLVKGRGK
jgi:hypothetical protein